MLKGRRFYIVDAFSDRPFAGNPAVIVPDAEGLSDRAMQALAAELRMEAGFVFKATSPDADVRLRFFSPGAEVDVSGHVTVATYAALQSAGRLPEQNTVRQESRAGILTVELSPGTPSGSTLARGGQGTQPPFNDAPWVTLDLGKPRFGAALDRKEVAESLRVSDNQLAPSLLPRAVTCGVSLAVVAMAQPHALSITVPDMAKLAAFSRRRGVLGICAFARPGVHPQSALVARFFFPAVGPDEDVVSGAALAAICAYAVRERQIPCIGTSTFQTDQGHNLGRPNQAHVTVRAEAGQIADIRVKGRGILVASGEFTPAA